MKTDHKGRTNLLTAIEELENSLVAVLFLGLHPTEDLGYVILKNLIANKIQVGIGLQIPDTGPGRKTVMKKTSIPM